MAKIIRKHSKKTVKLESMAALLFVISLFCYLGSSIFLKSYNVSLGKTAAEYETKISTVKEEKETLRIEVEQLRDRDRILAQAKDNGLNTNSDNVVMLGNNH